MSSDMNLSDNGHLHVLWWRDTRRVDLEEPRLQERDGPYTLVFEPSSAETSSAETPVEPPAEPKAEPPKKVRRRSPSNAAQSTALVSSSSAARPAASSSPSGPGKCSERIRIKLATPLYDRFLGALPDDRHAKEFLQYLEMCCFSGKEGELSLLNVTAAGRKRTEAMPLSAKLENLLRICLGKREYLVQKAGIDIRELPTYVASGEELRNLMNDWRDDVESYMQPEKQEIYRKLIQEGRNQDAHQLKKSVFSTYQFHISGCKYLIGKLIELPILHDNGGAIHAISQLLDDFQKHKDTPQYKDAVKRSREKAEGEKRLSNQLWWAKYWLHQGENLSTRVREAKVSLLDLSQEDQQLVKAYDDGKLERALRDLKIQQCAPYLGTHVEARCNNQLDCKVG